MKKIVLTSAGFDNPNIADKVKELLSKDVNNLSVLFVVSAAVTESQKKILPLCKSEIVDLGINEKQIVSYDFDYEISSKEILDYDMIYVAGGSTQALLNKMGDFKSTLDAFLDQGGVYVGVSAGSVALASNYEDGLGYVSCPIKVHQAAGTREGKIVSDSIDEILLTDVQALLVSDQCLEVIS
ncbi:hypothetical protein EZV73_04255 [Acidaminobacter sp. JC074]|uniref:Type 1 glutamine amidotransferase-like domain-containing protein n=1 Tax=Acidaminobacter sp. JC074 TaxID=2530199 RepID=UPI001F108DD7|nr:Type 1 glutamine amidotransferase-like domain-containing protein [Acidaminobacter sp. JC074]MCH4886765.1 hypothetical protein [Acidaminobacter sp. JC074]